MDDKQRIALVESRTKGNEPGVPARLIRYQLGNHLGSVSLELDDEAQVISYEEFYPYGSTSYQALDENTRAVAKRYRYTGKERDEETGLYYHRARYYLCWLGRWPSADPLGIVPKNSQNMSERGDFARSLVPDLLIGRSDHEEPSRRTNLYTFVSNRPLALVDLDGQQPTPPSSRPEERRFAPDQPPASLDRALIIPSGEQKVIELKIPDLKQARNSTECFAKACEMAEEGNKTLSRPPHLLGKDKAINVAIAEDQFGGIVVDPLKARKGLNYIDRALEAGYRVVVGASYSTKGTKSNRLTEHFLTIYGRSYDEKGRVFYKFRDPGLAHPAGPKGEFPSGVRLFVDSATGKMFRVPTMKGAAEPIVSHEYNVTQVRTYKELAP
jgi:RHS repeat-associated protein